MMFNNEVNGKVHADWIQLMKEARDIGLSKKEVRQFFQKDKSIKNEPFKKIRE